MVRHSARTLIFIAISVIAVLLLLKTVPTGFLPNEDQGYLMADVQLPEAASAEPDQGGRSTGSTPSCAGTTTFNR